jgi:hypothetical protein
VHYERAPNTQRNGKSSGKDKLLVTKKKPTYGHVLRRGRGHKSSKLRSSLRAAQEIPEKLHIHFQSRGALIRVLGEGSDPAEGRQEVPQERRSNSASGLTGQSDLLLGLGTPHRVTLNPFPVVS